MTAECVAGLATHSLLSRKSAAKIRDPVRRNLTAHAETPAITGSLPAQGRQRRKADSEDCIAGSVRPALVWQMKRVK